ncbi:MAG: hypothetical protein HY908_00020, partial [Myxococcales bacterium]|nr:hypothetical protein [Myxococcales bacterium]
MNRICAANAAAFFIALRIARACPERASAAPSLPLAGGGLPRVDSTGAETRALAVARVGGRRRGDRLRAPHLRSGSRGRRRLGRGHDVDDVRHDGHHHVHHVDDVDHLDDVDDLDDVDHLDDVDDLVDVDQLDDDVLLHD